MNPNVDGHGITAEEWNQDWTPEEREGYFTGVYDVVCRKCQGLRVVAEIAVDALDEEQKGIYARWREVQKELAECDRINAMERATGA